MCVKIAELNQKKANVPEETLAFLIKNRKSIHFIICCICNIIYM